MNTVIGGRSRLATSQAIDFARLAGTLVLGSARLKKRDEISAENQQRAPLIDDRQSLLDPGTHRVSMNAEQRGDLLHGVVAVDLGQLGVGAA